MMTVKGERIRIKGTVQGVGFRPAVYRVAVKLGINGTVRNDGADVIIECDRGEELLKELRRNLPSLAVVTSIESEPCNLKKTDGFAIVESHPGSDGISIPTDTAICDRCVSEIRSPGRRHGYAFTTCTNCGPRFTLLSSLPYDRKNTAMSDFRMCQRCKMEFSDPDDRRLHHQTICCPECGPSYSLLDGNGKAIKGDPIGGFADILSEGGIGIAKGWGGMHICCTLENIGKLREWYRRPQKPFAVMVRDADAASKYGNPNENEILALMSPHRPIVLVEKKDVPDGIAPGLDNVGLFLPYSGMQHILFDRLRTDALVMTSANPPGEPMITDDSQIMEMRAEAYLLHNQKIVNRADDSVLRMYKDKTYFIRKSRGSTPSYVDLDPKLSGGSIAVGAQENLTGAVSKDCRIYQTQYIGHGSGIGVPEYLEESIKNLLGMTGSVPEIIAADLHPGYTNKKIARRFAEDYGIPLVEIQHHWAHAASLLTDGGRTSGVVLTLDGTGYGSDGNAWGGEVISTDLASYSRDAHLEYIPLLGSEKALHDLRRLKFAIDRMNGKENEMFDDRECSVLEKMMVTSVKTSSMGRILDALSFTLGVCDVRTYDGEPAMKLEPLLARGKLIDGYETYCKNGVVGTAHLFDRIGKNDKPADVVYSVVYNIMDCLVESAVESADRNGYGSVGLSGGVSYNSVISSIFEKIAGKYDHDLIFHDRIPNGDGGISAGQTAVALTRIG